MKRCGDCGDTKPLTEFYRHPKTADGREADCKECKRKQVKARREANRELHSRRDQEREQDPWRKAQKAEAQRRHRAKHPEKYKARGAVRSALRNGTLKREPCRHCGNPRSQAHHTDYSRPLDVVWACFKCHREHEHGQTTVCATDNRQPQPSE